MHNACKECIKGKFWNVIDELEQNLYWLIIKLLPSHCSLIFLSKSEELARMNKNDKAESNQNLLNKTHLKELFKSVYTCIKEFTDIGCWFKLQDHKILKLTLGS